MRKNNSAWRQLTIVAGLAMTFLTPMSSSGAGSADAKMPTAKIGNNVVKLEVAASGKEIADGLMHRESMPEDQGMVFLFKPARVVTFWMCNTLIPLDMLFIEDGKIVKISRNVPPCNSQTKDCSDCPQYPDKDGVHVSHVIELNGDYCKRHSIKEGDKVELQLR